MKKRKKDNRLFVSLIILVSIVMVFGGMLLIKPDILQKFTGEQDSEVFKADDVTTTYSGDKSGAELSSSEPITYTPTPETEVASAENSEQLPAKTTEEIPLTQPIETQPKIQSGYFENLKTINYAFNSGTTQNKIILSGTYVAKTPGRYLIEIGVNPASKTSEVLASKQTLQIYTSTHSVCDADRHWAGVMVETSIDNTRIEFVLSIDATQYEAGVYTLEGGVSTGCFANNNPENNVIINNIAKTKVYIYDRTTTTQVSLTGTSTIDTRDYRYACSSGLITGTGISTSIKCPTISCKVETTITNVEKSTTELQGFMCSALTTTIPPSIPSGYFLSTSTTNIWQKGITGDTGQFQGSFKVVNPGRILIECALPPVTKTAFSIYATKSACDGSISYASGYVDGKAGDIVYFTLKPSIPSSITLNSLSTGNKYYLDGFCGAYTGCAKDGGKEITKTNTVRIFPWGTIIPATSLQTIYLVK